MADWETIGPANKPASGGWETVGPASGSASQPTPWYLKGGEVQAETTQKQPQQTSEMLFYDPNAETKSSGERLTELGISTAVGAGLGLGAPKLIGAVGEMAGRLSNLKGLGFLRRAGVEAGATVDALKKVSPMARMAGGAAAGGVGDAASQAVDAAGGGAIPQTMAAVAGGGAVPLVKKAADFSYSKGARLYRAMAHAGDDVSGATRRAYEALRGGADPYAPAKTVAGTVNTKANQIAQAGEQQAGQVQAAAQAKGTATKISELRRSVATSSVAKTLESQLQAEADRAEQTFGKIGTPQEPTDIGDQLRNRAVSLKRDKEAATQAQFDADQKVRDQVVQGKEAKGQLVEQTPAFKSFLEDLDKKLLIGKAKTSEKLADVTDPARVASFNTVRDSILGKRVPVTSAEAQAISARGGKIVEGTNPLTGDRVLYRQFPSSFSALDDVRRRVGKAANFGAEVEGYAGISTSDAKWLYAQLSDIQKEYAGKPQELLLQHYAENKEGQIMFKTAMGKTATAAEKFDPEEYKVDPSRLPKRFFQSKEGVEKLTQIVGGDKTLVEQSARAFVAKQTQGSSAAQLGRFIDRNSDWLREVGSLKTDLQAHQKALVALEARQISGEKAVETLKTQAIQAAERSRTVPAELRKTADKQAADLVKQSEALAARLRIAPERAGEFMDKYIGKGFTSDELHTITAAVANDPQARAAFPDALRQSLSKIPAGKLPDGRSRILDAWQNGLKDLISGSGLVDAKQLLTLDAQIQHIDQTLQGKEKLALIRNIILSALGGGISANVGSSTISAKQRIEGALQ